MSTTYLNYLPWLLCAIPVVYTIASRHKGELPPGPKPLPFLGNIFDIPTDAAWKIFQRWGKQYGGHRVGHYSSLHDILTTVIPRRPNILGGVGQQDGRTQLSRRSLRAIGQTKLYLLL